MRKERRWKLVALLATGMAIGVVIVATPAGAHVANWAHNWNKHIKPRADARYLPGGNLPGGRTIRGTYAVADNDQGAEPGLATSAISFGWRLSSAPTEHFIPTGTPPPASCPGTAANPQAKRGHLCVYEVAAFNVEGQFIANPADGAENAASRYGAVVVAQSVADGPWATAGTWAVRSVRSP